MLGEGEKRWGKIGRWPSQTCSQHRAAQTPSFSLTWSLPEQRYDSNTSIQSEFTCGYYAYTISTCLFQSSPPHKEQSCQHQGESRSISTRLACRSTPDPGLLLLCKCWQWHYCVANDSLGIVVMLQLPINSPRGWHGSSHPLTSASLIKDYFIDITKTKTMKP